MKVSKATRAEAIECLLTCAAARQAGEEMFIGDACDSRGDVFDLVNTAWVVARGDDEASPTAHDYHAAASLLDAGWSP